jgi:hypothetical protein
MILSVSRLRSIHDRMICECGTVGRMKIRVGNQSTRQKRVPVPLYAAQILHDPYHGHLSEVWINILFQVVCV